MFAAARSGDAGEIRRLEAAGTDEEESDARVRRAMHVAAEHGHVDVIRTLAESWVLRWIHKTPERVYAHHSHRRGQQQPRR
jgi:hypothetical protein